MRKSHKDLLDALRQKNQHRSDEIEAWSKSERPKELLAEIHRRIEAGDEREGPSVHGRFPRMVWVAAAIVVLVVAVVVAILASTGTSPNPPSASIPTTSTVQVEHVTQGELVEEIAALFKEHPGFVPGAPDPASASPLEKAQLLRIVKGDEASRFDEEARLDRGKFALWLWRAWKYVLPQPIEISAPSDTATATDEEREAIEAMVALKIMAVDDSRAFRPGDDLTDTEAHEALSALRALLETR